MNKRSFMVLWAIGAFGFFATASPFEGEKVQWHGFDRYDFIMDEQTLAITPFKSLEGEGAGVKDPEPGKRRCIVVVPAQATSGNPWSWRGCYWDHQPQTEIELLKRGFHVAYISASATLKPGGIFRSRPKMPGRWLNSSPTASPNNMRSSKCLFRACLP